MDLAISHYIYLDKKHRYALADGKAVAASGISVPVWFENGRSSEPADEVFCNYVLHNIVKREHIGFKKDGYEINIPQLPEGFQLPKDLTPEEWLCLEPEEIKSIMNERFVPPYGKSLYDPIDGGSGNLYFIVDSRGKFKGSTVNVHHIVHISDMDVLQETMC